MPSFFAVCVHLFDPPRLGPKNIRFLVIGRLQKCAVTRSFLIKIFANGEIRDYVIYVVTIIFPIIQSMVAKRGLTNWANVHTPLWKSRLKHSTAEIQSIKQFWRNWTSFHSPPKQKCAQRPETGDFFGPYVPIAYLSPRGMLQISSQQTRHTLLGCYHVFIFITWVVHLTNSSIFTDVKWKPISTRDGMKVGPLDDMWWHLIGSINVGHKTGWQTKTDWVES